MMHRGGRDELQEAENKDPTVDEATLTCISQPYPHYSLPRGPKLKHSRFQIMFEEQPLGNLDCMSCLRLQELRNENKFHSVGGLKCQAK